MADQERESRLVIAALALLLDVEFEPVEFGLYDDLGVKQAEEYIESRILELPAEHREALTKIGKQLGCPTPNHFIAGYVFVAHRDHVIYPEVVQ